MRIYSVNPATEKRIKGYALATKTTLDKTAQQAHKASKAWKEQLIGQRRDQLKSISRQLLAKKNLYGRIITQEMGKIIHDAVAEVEKCAVVVDYYAEHAEHFLQEEPIETDAKRSFVAFEPLGTILGVMPWNFPFWQVFRFAIPSIIAGNTVILKHSNVVPGCSYALHNLFAEAIETPNVFQSIITDAKGISYLLPKVQGVSLTGSVAAGRTVAEQAGYHLKKIVLELGGSDPYIVLNDTDLEQAAKAAVQARFINCGQSCIAAKRFLIEKSIAEKFTDLVTEHVAQLQVGNPADEKTDIGPLVTNEAREKLEQQVKQSIRQGAKVAYGGKKISGKGYFYEPTILTNVTRKMPVLHDEIFGPVMPIRIVKNEQEALEEANTTEFGLGASVWTQNDKKAQFFARHLEAGTIAINAMVASDPRLPFGGIKNSGIGRELSRYGLLEFVNIKSIKQY